MVKKQWNKKEVAGYQLSLGITQPKSFRETLKEMNIVLHFDESEWTPEECQTSHGVCGTRHYADKF